MILASYMCHVKFYLTRKKAKKKKSLLKKIVRVIIKGIFINYIMCLTPWTRCQKRQTIEMSYLQNVFLMTFLLLSLVDSKRLRERLKLSVNGSHSGALNGSWRGGREGRIQSTAHRWYFSTAPTLTKAALFSGPRTGQHSVSNMKL
jgi:hypothetical protein